MKVTLCNENVYSSIRNSYFTPEYWHGRELLECILEMNKTYQIAAKSNQRDEIHIHNIHKLIYISILRHAHAFFTLTPSP
jgi:hypothetical protein